MTKIKEVVSFLEGIAPSSLQEGYDNAGLIVGDFNTDISGILVCLDSVEETIDEAIKCGANLIVAHHPIVFEGLKRFNGSNYVERTVIKAIQNNIAIYATHTNLDSVKGGVSWKIAEKLGLKNVSVLSPKSHRLFKLETYVPKDQFQHVLNSMFKAGAGNIDNYSECSFNMEGVGSFKANDQATPFVGEKGERHLETEVKVEVVVGEDDKYNVIKALKSAHPYETVAYYLFALENTHPTEGLGVVGELSEEMETLAFLGEIKKVMKAGVVRYTNPVENKGKAHCSLWRLRKFLAFGIKKGGGRYFFNSRL